MIVPEDPAVSRHGGTIRTAAFVRAFTELGWHVELMLPPARPGSAPSPAGHGRPSRLSALKRALSPMPTALGLLVQRGPRLRRRLRDVDLILFSNFESRIMVPRRLRSRVWFDQSDAHSRYAASEANHRSGLARSAARLQSSWLRVQERRWVLGSAIATAAGFGDARYSSGRGGTVAWLPTPIDAEGATPPPDGRVVGMIGNFGYAPNRQAYDAFARDWLPAVRSQGWRFLVAGRRSDSLPAAAGVEIAGEVASTADFYRRVDVAVCPVERGGGIKVKSLEALVYGRPVIASPHVVDGFAAEFHRLFVICDGPAELPALDALTVDPEDVQLARDRFSEDEFTRQVARFVESWRTNVT